MVKHDVDDGEAVVPVRIMYVYIVVGTYSMCVGEDPAKLEKKREIRERRQQQQQW